MKRTRDYVWTEVTWQRPFSLESVLETLTHLATAAPIGNIVWETRASGGKLRYLLGTDARYMAEIQSIFGAHGAVRFRNCREDERADVTLAKRLKVSHPALSLQTNTTLAVLRAALAALVQTPENEETVLQIVLGAPTAPTTVAADAVDPTAGWLQWLSGNTPSAPPEIRANLKEKRAAHGFQAIIRIGASGKISAARARIYNLLAALRILDSVGARIYTAAECPEKVKRGHAPWHWPLQLSVKELANFLLLPVGDEELTGTPKLHPKLCLPPSWYGNPAGFLYDRTFAISPDGCNKLSIAPDDSLEHTHIIGPTGSGKSTVLLNLILADIKAGRGVLVIDPKADLVNDILARIPEKHDGDVVVLDPSDACPVGFNPLAFNKNTNPCLVADAVLAVFKEVFSENWGIRSQDVLSAALLTLAQCEGASLLWLPSLLTDEKFRRKVTAQISDKIGLEPFWSAFEAIKDNERRMEIAPVLNKIRQFLLRPSLRSVLGQANPKFTLQDLFNKRRIVLVPLNKGLIGSESARLLGSLIVGMTWTLALSRAKLPPEQRNLISVYIDELQDYLSLPTDLSDALAQARGLGVGLNLAHQYREQLPPLIRAGVDANTRNKIVFGLNSTDAKCMAAMATNLDAVDFMSLPRYQIYASFMQHGKNTGWLSGQTLPAPPPIRDAIELRAKSMAVYGKARKDVEDEFFELLKPQKGTEIISDMPIGRVRCA
ncbi:MAG TPA: hypothetical protein DEQ02_10015 [Ruminococcaceae bacterium]|nr:hypothetical protein [Oscillospiraceae bacterium]